MTPDKTVNIKDTQSLTNSLLVSSPTMEDKEFHNTVIYIYHHNEVGALGFILNRPSRVLYGYVVQQLDLEEREFQQDILDRPMLIGGPVNRDRGFILHMKENDELEMIKPKNKDSLIDILTNEPNRSEFFFGHSGWQSGQLEHELMENSWQVLDSDCLDELMHTPLELRHHLMWKKLGANLSTYSSQVGHC